MCVWSWFKRQASGLVQNKATIHVYPLARHAVLAAAVVVIDGGGSAVVVMVWLSLMVIVLWWCCFVSFAVKFVAAVLFLLPKLLLWHFSCFGAAVVVPT